MSSVEHSPIVEAATAANVQHSIPVDSSAEPNTHAQTRSGGTFRGQKRQSCRVKKEQQLKQRRIEAQPRAATDIELQPPQSSYDSSEACKSGWVSIEADTRNARLAGVDRCTDEQPHESYYSLNYYSPYNSPTSPCYDPSYCPSYTPTSTNYYPINYSPYHGPTSPTKPICTSCNTTAPTNLACPICSLNPSPSYYPSSQDNPTSSTTPTNYYAHTSQQATVHELPISASPLPDIEAVNEGPATLQEAALRAAADCPPSPPYVHYTPLSPAYVHSEPSEYQPSRSPSPARSPSWNVHEGIHPSMRDSPQRDTLPYPSQNIATSCDPSGHSAASRGTSEASLADAHASYDDCTNPLQPEPSSAHCQPAAVEQSVAVVPGKRKRAVDGDSSGEGSSARYSGTPQLPAGRKYRRTLTGVYVSSSDDETPSEITSSMATAHGRSSIPGYLARAEGDERSPERQRLYER